MSLILGEMGERIRRFLNSRQALNRVAVMPTVQPTLDVHRLVADVSIRNRVVPVDSGTVYPVTAVLNDTDIVVTHGIVHYDTDKFTQVDLRVYDDEGNYVTICPSDSTGWFSMHDHVNMPFVLPAGWWLACDVGSFVANDNIEFEARYEFYPSRTFAGVP